MNELNNGSVSGRREQAPPGSPSHRRSLNRVGPVVSGPVSLMKTDTCLGVSEDSPGHRGSVVARPPPQPQEEVVWRGQLPLWWAWIGPWPWVVSPNFPQDGNPSTDPSHTAPASSQTFLPAGAHPADVSRAASAHQPPPLPHSAVALSPPTPLSGHSVLGAGGAKSATSSGQHTLQHTPWSKGHRYLPPDKCPCKVHVLRTVITMAPAIPQVRTAEGP